MKIKKKTNRRETVVSNTLLTYWKTLRSFKGKINRNIENTESWELCKIVEQKIKKTSGNAPHNSKLLKFWMIMTIRLLFRNTTAPQSQKSILFTLGLLNSLTPTLLFKIHTIQTWKVRLHNFQILSLDNLKNKKSNLAPTRTQLNIIFKTNVKFSQKIVCHTFYQH